MTPQGAAAQVPQRTSTSLVVLFGTYLALLAWIVLWKLDVPWIGGVQRVIKIVPFAATSGNGASAPLEVAMNLVIFIPFGVYLGLLAPRWSWWKVGASAAGASLALEITQYVLAIGSTDVTDVVVNTAGGLAGLGLLALARRHSAVTTSTMTRICSIGTVGAVLASAIFVAAPLHMTPPDGGHLQRSATVSL
ncbi:VanZ family protein [Leifsonia sp. YIM 134122]|uniref:VanZ family protein n=1 Tax=Leifsonia stereocauli TaxID=3134136 RepID=A0ABU9VZA9_9MICO